MHRFVVLACFGLLIGCAANSPLAISMKGTEELQDVPADDLCNAYGVNHGETVKMEIQRRGLVSSNIWPMVEARQIAVGMNRCALFASMGKPTVYGSSRRILSSSGEVVFYNYADPVIGGFKHTNVTTVNGIITVIED
jgi:hypothetical protein